MTGYENEPILKDTNMVYYTLAGDLCSDWRLNRINDAVKDHCESGLFTMKVQPLYHPKIFCSIFSQYVFHRCSPQQMLKFGSEESIQVIINENCSQEEADFWRTGARSVRTRGIQSEYNFWCTVCRKSNLPPKPGCGWLGSLKRKTPHNFERASENGSTSCCYL